MCRLVTGERSLFRGLRRRNENPGCHRTCHGHSFSSLRVANQCHGHHSPRRDPADGRTTNMAGTTTICAMLQGAQHNGRLNDPGQSQSWRDGGGGIVHDVTSTRRQLLSKRGGAIKVSRKVPPRRGKRGENEPTKKAKVESDKKRYTSGAYDTASFNPTNTAGNLRPKSRRHLKNNESKELCGRDIITYLAEKGGIKGSVNVSNGGKSQRSVQKVRSTARAAAVGLQKNWHCSICGKDPCDCSGMVLTISQIDSFIHAEAGKRKKKKIGLDDSETEIQEEVENDQNPADGIDDEE